MKLPGKAIRVLSVIAPMFIFIACGTEEVLIIGAAQDNVPEGAWLTKEKITNRFAPQGFSAVVGWAQFATLSGNQHGEPASISVDYMRLIEEDPIAGTQTLFEESYTADRPNGLNITEGALYDRFPTWYANNDHQVPLSTSTILGGFHSIDVSQIPNNIAHWWTARRACKPTASYYVEMRVRITGQAGLQLGADFWRDLTVSWAGYNVNNRESFASDWFGDTHGEYITIRVPHGNTSSFGTPSFWGIG